MIHVLALFLISTLAGCASCSSDLKENGKENGKEEKPDTEEVRPESFASDDEMLDYIQKVHLNYMWDGAEPTSGLARERIHLDGDYPEKDQNVVTTGGSGFGIAGLLVGIERGFIPREEGVKRLTKIADYLKRADRFHGVWPHWLYGPTGQVKPFGQKDNGGDLVESCFLMQSLLCVRQYFRDGNEQEKALAEKIDQLWKEMEFSWYQNGKDVIYWHWSPEYNWEMNFPLEGYNEALIVYVLAASSPTYPVPASAYHNGWARGGGIKSDSAPYGLPLELKHNGAEKLGGLGTILAHRSGPAQPERPLCQLLERGAQPCPLQLPLLRGESQTIQRLRRGLLGTDRQLLYQRLCSPLPGRQRPWCHHTDSSLVQFSLHTGGIHACTEVFLFQRRLDLGQVRILRCLLRGK